MSLLQRSVHYEFFVTSKDFSLDISVDLTLGTGHAVIVNGDFILISCDFDRVFHGI